LVLPVAIPASRRALAGLHISAQATDAAWMFVVLPRGAQEASGIAGLPERLVQALAIQDNTFRNLTHAAPLPVTVDIPDYRKLKYFAFFFVARPDESRTPTP
jgi:hypothetical protein